MSLKFRYFLLIGVLHIVLGICFFLLFKEDKMYFLLGEFFLLILFLFSIGLYQKMIKPIQLIRAGTYAIKDNDFTIKYVKTGSSEIDDLVDVYNEMIDSLRTEKTRTEEQSYFLEKLIEVSPIGFVILDFDGFITDINSVAIDILKINSNWKKMNVLKSKNSLLKQILTIEEGESKLLVQNGYKKYKCQIQQIIHNGFPRKFIILEDMTSEMLKTEKEAYGKVIRMMAHEVNNSIGAINSIIQTVLEFGFSDKNADEDLKESLVVARDRNNSLTKFIDHFADIIRLPSPVKKDCDLHKLILETAKPWELIAGKVQIEIIYSFGRSLDAGFNVNLDPVQVERVISNALKNAIESIGHKGKIVIKTNPENNSFCIVDDGPGITSINSKKLFSPFFSTKVNGQGIGLMLSRDIVENHGGSLQLYTNKEVGLTYFEVKL